MGKESFVLYTEIWDTVSLMTNEEAGRLFKMILNYESGLDLMEGIEDPSYEGEAFIAFSFIRRQLVKNDAKDQKTINARSEAGKKGAIRRWQKMANDSNAMANDSNAIAKDGKAITNDSNGMASKGEANPKQTSSKTQANAKQNPSKTEANVNQINAENAPSTIGLEHSSENESYININNINTPYINKDSYPTDNNSENKEIEKDNDPLLIAEYRDRDSNRGVGEEEETGERDHARATRKPKEFVPPTLDEVKAYCAERHSNVDPVVFYDYFTAGDWTDSEGKKVQRWKQKLITWEKFHQGTKQAPRVFNNSDYLDEILLREISGGGYEQTGNF